MEDPNATATNVLIVHNRFIEDNFPEHRDFWFVNRDEEAPAEVRDTLRVEEGGSLVGNASYTVPGAAGDTSSIAKASRGIKNMILADGPAGLRLQPVFKTNKEGNLLPGGSVLGDIVEPFDPKYTDENSDTYYQYCTAIPIGWALAQSWNMALLEKIGSMVGVKMEEFGVDLWLAPALNIHRNPLCGRNFEYYSEDPVVSGKAAAITLGVQTHPGKGTTIKHLAANSQEDNRYFTNSHISERAIREIYLKGFEIAVKESQPLSIMTSYNLLNRTHTANRYDLLQAVARDEWGFKGFVMTDWYTSQDEPGPTGNNKVIYPISASTGCIHAGNDVQMPGCQKNVDDIVRAIRTGEEIDGYILLDFLLVKYYTGHTSDTEGVHTWQHSTKYRAGRASFARQKRNGPARPSLTRSEI